MKNAVYSTADQGELLRTGRFALNTLSPVRNNSPESESGSTVFYNSSHDSDQSHFQEESRLLQLRTRDDGNRRGFASRLIGDQAHRHRRSGLSRMNAKSDPIAVEQQGVTPPRLLYPDSPAKMSASIDFAHLIGHRLLVYGWVLGFSSQVDRAFISIGGTTVDLKSLSQSVRRPDVSQHFKSGPGEEHGFYALIDFQHSLDQADSFLLSVTSRSGEIYESRGTFQRHEQVLYSLPASDLATLRELLSSLPAMEMARLKLLLSAASNGGDEGDLPALPLPAEFEIDLCCVLDKRILIVYGWCLDPTDDLASVELSVSNDVFDLLHASTPVPRRDINSDTAIYRQRASSRPPGFVFVQPLTATHNVACEAIVAITTNNANSFFLTRTLSSNVAESRDLLLALLNKMDVESALLVVERLISAIPELHATRSLRNLLELSHDRLTEQLPLSIEHANHWPRYWIHIDQAIPIPGGGVLLAGWFYAEDGEATIVNCNCGEARFSVSENWTRQTRADVTTYLEAAGADSNDDQHGFVCYVKAFTKERPYWLSVVSRTGEERRMKLPAFQHAQSALQTVRSILGTFTCEQRQMRTLMDRQVGPSVRAAWAARKIPSLLGSAETFGEEPAGPKVTIIVPLYGRWDFAEIQMSQFANDETFRNVELIYVVDDPSIVDQFRLAAPGLFGIYQIPFTVASSGINLGFAGANNYAATLARGKYLLLMNSDVLPAHPRWIPRLIKSYSSLKNPGLLGVKLIYEDSTVQHAGIEFRRHSEWGGMWINDHPSKGHMGMDLRGIREVDAVTAACALIRADHYRELGGLSEDYIIGDFEDSDLCLKARRNGLRNYVALDIELYHLERQSQNKTGDARWRANLTAYNCWLHNERWSGLIEELANRRLPSKNSRNFLRLRRDNKREIGKLMKGENP